MENFEFQGGSHDTCAPVIKFSPEGFCKIEGESSVANALEFYTPLSNSIVKYLEEIKEPLTIDFKITYFDTTSSRYFSQMFKTIKAFENKGAKVVINWYVQDWDLDMKHNIEDFMEECKIKINVIPFKSEG